MRKKLSLGFVLIMLALCPAITAFADAAEQAFLSEVARLTAESGGYEAWTMEEKRFMLQSMKQNGFADEETVRALGTEEEIDAFLMKRYAPPDIRGDLSVISLMRIAWVEMGPYTDWPNETWVWFTDMMFEAGLWSSANDVDVYATPGEEAIPPAEAIKLARQQLLRDGVPAEDVEQSQVNWHYMTHASDVERTGLKYLVTFQGQETHYVWITPDGKVFGQPE
ncbi:MAG: hypothetical protein MRZ54_10725 [Clostridiales bacterium]|nr:hypothetical protein [Clostridiales bacterium]